MQLLSVPKSPFARDTLVFYGVQALEGVPALSHLTQF